LASRGVPADNDKIGYYIKKLTFNELGEGACLKIIVNHYKADYARLKEISKSRGTNLDVLLTSYNISFNGRRNDDNQDAVPVSDATGATEAQGDTGATGR